MGAAVTLPGLFALCAVGAGLAATVVGLAVLPSHGHEGEGAIP